MRDILIIILLIIIAIAAMIFVPQWLMRRAIPQVIRIFRAHNAIDIKGAKYIDELGLQQRGMLQKFGRRRDYKPYALEALMKIEIIQMTEDGRLYLSEEKLIASGLDKHIRRSR